MITIWHGVQASLGLPTNTSSSTASVPCQQPPKLVLCQHPNRFNLRDAEESNAASNKRPPWACPFLARVSLWQMSDLASLEMSALWNWKAVVISARSFSQPNTHGAQGGAKCGGIWANFPAVHSTNVLMPSRSCGCRQTHRSFRAHLVLNKNSPHDYKFESESLLIQLSFYPSVLPVDFIKTGPKGTLSGSRWLGPQEVAWHLVQKVNY